MTVRSWWSERNPKLSFEHRETHRRAGSVGRMIDTALLETITTETASLAAAARRAGPSVQVPSCPEWNMAKLVKHTGTTHAWAAAVVTAGTPVSPGSIDLGLPDDPIGFPDWLENGATQLVDRLVSAGVGEPCWSWGADQHVRFWARRMAHETVVHRWDAQDVSGQPDAIEPLVAVDGIDELFGLVAYHPTLSEFRGAGETLHLHATDCDGEWLVRFADAGMEITREHAKGDVAVRGSASDLMLFVAGRVDYRSLEVFGNAAIVDDFAARFRY